MPREIFVSYGREDQAKVKDFVRRLENADASVWMDEKRLTPGGYFDDELQRAIEDCTILLLMASEAAMASDWVRNEVLWARNWRKRIIPVHLEPTHYHPSLNPILSPLNYLAMYVGDPEESFCRLVSALAESGVRITSGPYFDKVGPLAIERPPLHASEYVQIFQADSAGMRLAVHVVGLEHARAEDVRLWFGRRLACWKRVRHPSVLVPHDSSDPVSERPAPFLVTDFVPRCTNLQKSIEQGLTLPRELIVKILETAAGVCLAAHKNNVFLLSLPIRHFLLCGDSMDVRLTGFEAATSAETEQDRYLHRETLRRFCRKDCSDVAPEVLQEFRPLAQTADIFALGVLLETLQHIHRGSQRSIDCLEGPHRSDSLACLAYHCLAADPNLRFQTVDQFLTFLREPRGLWPATVEVPAGPIARLMGDRVVHETIPAFNIGMYPVTNFEYERFRREGGQWAKDIFTTHSLAHKHQAEDGSPSFDREQALRLSGPWCPAVHASFLDAQKYCQWLSLMTGKRWRLPRESEWVRAAALGDDQPYPWGLDCPTPAHANYERFYGGPTVVGACPRGRSAAGCWDMGGNVWEWCSDFIAPDEPKRVLKGGSYDFSAGAAHVSARRGALVTCRSPHVGFRILCEV